MKPLDGREFLNTEKDSLPCSVHRLLFCVILVICGSGGGRLTDLMSPRDVFRRVKVLAQPQLQVFIPEF
jgi:hypothetical protein